jgi:hypothetical protein
VLHARQIVLRRHVGPSDWREQLHQRDPLLITERTLQRLGEQQAASLVDRHDSSSGVESQRGKT